MPVYSDISLSVVIRSSELSSCTEGLPVIRANICRSAVETFRKFAVRAAAFSTSRRFLSSGSWVAIPTGQRPLPQMRYWRHPRAISAEEAQAIALEHAGLAESDVTFIYAVPDYDDGRGVYDVEFYRGTEEYDYEISAADGSILSYDHEIEGRMAGAEGAPSATQNAAVPSPIAPLTPSDVALTQDDAKRIALETAKVSEADATFTSVEFDYDDGIASYQVDFVVDATEYEFEIDANTGAVLEYGTESIYD